MFDAGAIIGRLRLDKSGWDASVKKVKGDEKKLGKSFTAIGSKLTRGLTLPLLAMGAGAVKAFADFDKAMVESLAIMGNVSADLRKQMADTAKQLSGESVFAARDLAQAYFYLASAGLDAEQSIGALPVVTKFAQAGTFDLSLATDLLTDAQSALGLTVDDTAQNMENMTRVSDALVGANTLANASVQQFAEALTNRAAAALRTLNKDMEEGVAVLAAFADQGVKGRDAGMQLSIVLTNMETAARMNEAEWKRLGVSLYDAEGNMVNIADVIGDLEGLLGGMSDKQKSATLAQLGFNERAIKTIKVLLGTSEKVRQYETDLRNLGGITKEVSEKQMLSFTNQMTALKNEVVVIAVEFGEHLIPIIKKLVQDYVKPAVEWFKNLTDEQKELAVKVGLVAAAAGPLLAIFGNLFILVPKLAETFKFFATTPLGLVATGLLVIAERARAATLSFKEMSGALEEHAKVAGESMGWLEKTYHGVQAAYHKVIGGFDYGKAATKDLAAKTALLREEQAAYGKEVLASVSGTKLYQDALGLFNKVLGKTKKATKDVTETSGDLGDTLEDKTIPAIEAAGEETKTWLDYLKEIGIQTIQDKEDRVKELETYLGQLDQAYKNGKISLEDYRTATKEAKDEIEALSTTVIDTAIPAVRNLAGVQDQAVGEMEDRYFEFKTQVITDNDDIEEDFEATTERTESLWEQMADGIQTKMASSFSEVLSGATSLKDGLKGIWDSMKQSFFDIIGSMLAKWTTDFIGGILSGASSAASGILDSIGGAISSIFGGGPAGGLGPSAPGGGIGGLLGGAAGATPWGAVATGIGAMLGGIIGGGQGVGAQEAASRQLVLIWEEARNILNNIDNIKWINEDMKQTLWALADNLIPIADDIKHIGWTTNSILEGISKGIDGVIGEVGGVIDAIRNIPGLQHGAVVKRPTLARIAERAPSIPEIVAPLPEIEAAMTAAAAKAADMARFETFKAQQAATTRAAIVKQEIKIQMHNKVDLSGTIITDREHTRTRLMPEIIDALQSKAYITRLIEELRRAGAGI